MADTTPAFTVDPASPLWRHVNILEHVPGGGTCIWICPGCDVQYTSSYSRVKGHLCAIPGKGIKACPGKDKVPIPVSKIAAYIKEQEEADARIESRYGHPLLKTKGRGSQKSRASSSQSYTPSAAPDIVVESHPFMMRNEDETSNPKRARGPLEMAFGNDYREIADEAIARCLYANGLSFNVVRSPYWQDMIRKINEAPKGYTGPGYEKVRTTLLTKEVKHIKASLAPIKASWKETGVSIISDGWKDAKNRPLINVIAMSPKGAMFLKVVDCEGEVKDAQFIANILIECINEVGPQNVVQVVTDNAKNCRAAGMLVEKQFPHIFWTPCAVHSLNLMLQKLGTKIAWIKQVYDEAQDIQMFITNHHFSQAIFRSFSRLELLKVAETRFASNTIVLRRLVKVREALSSMVISHQWNTWRQSNNERATDIRRRILDETWWSRAEYLLSFTEPILGMIRFTDMDKPCLGEVYDGIDSMIENMRSVINAKEQDPEETFFKEVQLICVERWNKMTTPLHLLAFSLSPKYYSEEILALPTRVPPYRDAEVGEGARKAISKLFPDIEMEDAVTSEFADFVSSKGHTLAAIRDKYRKDAHSWWYLNGHKSPNLQILAIKILSQVASSSSAERNWSTYSFIHSVKRNRLASSKAEDLVYVHSNLRLLTHKSDEYKEGAAKLWDVEPESTDFDLPIGAPALPMEDLSSQHIFSANTSGIQSSNVNVDDNLSIDDDPYGSD